MRTLLRLSAFLLLCSLPCASQTVNASQEMTLQGVRSSNGAGSFVAARYATDGSLFLLYDQHDGVHVLKADATGQNLLAQAELGQAGDAPVAMALDASGNLYVTGTTSSGTLKGTQGSAFPAVADSSTNSFLAKYDANLKLVFLTFLGSGRTAASAIAATGDAVFVTGITFNAAFPVTPAAIQQTPSQGSTENGFVERFSADGSMVVYATYLTGANGDTMPGGIAADTTDDAYVTGATTASGYPTVAALQPTILGQTSGFLTSLNADGSNFNYSTFLAGSGMTGIALDPIANTLLLSGNVSLGQFPVQLAPAPIAATGYQTLLRLARNGQGVLASLLLVPGSQSHVVAGFSGDAWVSGSLGSPLFPGEAPPDYTAGDSFLLHVTADNQIDQTLRFGGLPVNNASYAALTSALGEPALSPNGATVALPGTLTATLDASLLATERFDLPMVLSPNAVLPNSLRDVVALTCTNSSACTGTGGLLSMVTTAASAPTLSLSPDDQPNLTLRNVGSGAATGLVIIAGGYTAASDCGQTLAPSTECQIALSGSGPGSVTVSAANSVAASTALSPNALQPDALALSSDEIDFGIVTSVDPVAVRSLTVTNLTSAPVSFTAAKDGGVTTPYSVSTAPGTCAAGSVAGSYTVPANGSCQLGLNLTVSNASANDGPVRSVWKIGPRDVIVTGFAQARALSLSASELDFGTQFSGVSSLRLPRYLYLSNNSSTAVQHSAVTLQAASPFAVTDNCPSTLEPHSICQLALSYRSLTAPSADAVTLSLDGGLSVLLTGLTQLAAGVSGSTSNPSLSVSTNQIVFATPVAVTTISATTEPVTIYNAGQASLPLAVAISGDFSVVNGCPATLPAGASCNLLVRFVPSAPGARDGMLSLTAGSGFSPSLVMLTGTASMMLPTNNGVLGIGETYVGEPVVAWYKVQQSFVSLTAVNSGAGFGVAFVEDSGSGHGTLAASDFSQSATAVCADCWLGVQYFSQAAGSQSGQLTLTSTTGGSPYALTLQADALPVTGLVLSPAAPDFGSVAIHSVSAPAILSLTHLLANVSSVTIQSIAVSGDYSLATNLSGGPSCTGQLAATTTCYVAVVFSPITTGDRSGMLTVVTSAGTVSTALNGYGIADPGIALNPTSLTFSNVPGTSASEQTLQLTNTSQGPITVGAPTASDPSFVITSACGVLAPGAICNITVGFLAQTATTSGTLLIPAGQTVNGQTLSNAYTVPLAGAYTSQGSGLQIMANEANLGSVATGMSGSTRSFALNNLSGKMLSIAFNVPRNFPLAGPSSCTTLAPGASCQFAVSFLPAVGGAITGSLIVTGTPTDGSAAVQTLTYLLGYGAATGTLSITGLPIPYSPVSFGQIKSGQTAQQTLSLSNTGSGPLTIRRLTTQPPFYATSTCGTTLQPSEECSVTLNYMPLYEVATGQTALPRSDTGALIIESDAATSADTVGLTGLAAPVFSSSPVSSAVLNAYTLSSGSLSFFNTGVGSASAPQSIVFTNTGSTTLHLLSIVTPPGFTTSMTCSTILSGASCSLEVIFAPTSSSTSQTSTGELQILTDASDALDYVTLMATSAAAPLTLSPATLDFGSVGVHATESLGVTVTNTAATPVLFSGVSANGDYTAALGTCPANGGLLMAGANCTLSVTFSPTSTGLRTGILSVATNATSLPLTVTLTGIGVQGQLQVTPGALSFGAIDVGATASLTLSLLNTGNAPITGVADGISGSGAAAFNVSVPCPVATLAPNQGCTETITFAPQSIGPAIATLIVSSSDPYGPRAVPMSGTGIAAGAFSLTVNGASSATMTVVSGSPAAFPLLLTPLNGFTGNVALTCAPIVAGPYATCSLNASTLTLNAAPVGSTATLETVSSHVRTASLGLSFVLLAMLGLRKQRGFAAAKPAILLASFCLMVTGCGSGSTPPSKLLYTPAGTYQYQVTASSTSGVPVASTVILNVIVQ